MMSLRTTFAIVILFLSLSVSGRSWYVANNGSDYGSGTEPDPYLTIDKAVSMVQPGETIYIKGGNYNLVTPINISKSGNEGALISLFAIPGVRPVLNFIGQPLDGANRGIRLTGSYWHIRGIDITNAGDNGMKIEGGSHNIIENCAFYRNRDSGLQIDGGASFNTIRNCDSYYNADPPDWGDADGFAPKLTAGSGNAFYGCRAWLNSDDGWDGYLRGADDISTTLENCWAFKNGYFEDGTNAGDNANGNGFKMGGSDDKTLKHNFTLKNCLAFGNKAKGFDQNNNMGSMILYNCTGHNNLVADFRMTGAIAAGKVMVVKNCVDLGKTAEIAAFAQQEKNSWMAPFVVTTGDFTGIDATAAYGPRKADGSLPDIDYMHLAAGSDLIDAGVDVGLPYSGSAPDLGCFEKVLTGLNKVSLAPDFLFYPNPVYEKGYFSFTAAKGGRCVIRLYDISGKYVKTLADLNLEPGDQQIVIDVSDIHEGLYLYRVELGDSKIITAKMVKLSGNGTGHSGR